MHLLVIPSWYPKFPGDIHGRFFREQAIQFRKSGIQVGLIYPQLNSIKKILSSENKLSGIEANEDEGIQTLKYYSYDYFVKLSFLHRLHWVRLGQKLYEEYQSNFGRPDIIHAHCMLNAGVLAKEISEKQSIPYIVTEHGSGYARGNFSRGQIKLSRQVAQKAARRLAVSGSLGKCLKSVLDEPSLDWDEVPNMLDELFEGSKNMNLQKSSRSFTILSVALLTKNKCIALLLEAFSKISKENENFELRIGGDGPERIRLEEMARSLSIDHRVHFLGKLERSQVIDEMSRANLFVLSSNYETFSVVTIEALACGTPVVATKCGGPESIVREKDGILVPINDSEAIAHAVLKINKDYIQYNSNEIRKDCLERYSAKSITNQILKIYAEVIKNGNLNAR